MLAISEREEAAAALKVEISKAAALRSHAASKRGMLAKQSTEGPSDWTEYAKALIKRENQTASSSLRSELDFYQRLEGMTPQELIKAIGEIAALNLSPEEFRDLESRLLDRLVEIDPAAALENFSDRINSDPDRTGVQLAEAMRGWANKDAKAAASWLDQKIADGTFDSKSLDGRSEIRIAFEGALVESLLTADIGAASQRIAAMPEDERREILQQIDFSTLDEQAQIAYAGLIQKLVPANEREGSFAHVVGELMWSSDYEEVSNFLDRAKASAGERAASAAQAVETHLAKTTASGGIDLMALNKTKVWLEREAPGKADRMLGKAIAEGGGVRGDFDDEKKMQLIMQYHRSSGNDEALVGFLTGYEARSNLKKAEGLIDQISDPAIRDGFRNRLKDL